MYLQNGEDRLDFAAFFHINAPNDTGIKIAVRLINKKMIENGTVLQDRYLIEKQIGAGGMGAVYLAVDRRFESFVAIKETFYKDDELGEAFEREARLLNGLRHPNLPHVSDYFSENAGHFLVMQFIEGEDLFDILKRDGAFPQSDIIRWTKNLLDALDYLHSQKSPIIHRDIKPQNLKITARGEIILLDFGLAKLNSDDAQGELSVFGYSRKYSPLEQIQGTGTDARSDIFALGATVYHLLTGKPPLDALARASAIVAGNSDPLESASDVNDNISSEVAHVLQTALKLNADQRFASAKAMRQALEYAVSANSIENKEELPEQILAAAPVVNTINSAETESFPALESFAAEVAIVSSAVNGSDQTAAIKIPVAQMPSSAPETAAHLNAAADVSTKINSRAKKSRLPLAAVAALLICVSLVAGYFINKANPSGKASESPVMQTESESNATVEQVATVSDVLPEVSESPLAKNAEPVKDKPRAIEKTVEKKETVDETTAKVETKVETKEKPKPAQVKTTRRGESRSSGETRTRVVDSSTVSDIESIFTGRPPEENDDVLRRREDRRRQREEMSDEELRDLRRQRRERRRQNRPNFPF